MGLGLVSAGQMPALGLLESQAEGQDWPGLSTEVPGRMPENKGRKRRIFCQAGLFSLVMDSPPLIGHWFASYPRNTLSLKQIWQQNQCYGRYVAGPCMGLDGTGY